MKLERIVYNYFTKNLFFASIDIEKLELVEFQIFKTTEYTGWEISDLNSNSVMKIILPEYKKNIINAFQKLKKEDNSEFTIKLYAKNGEIKTVNIKILVYKREGAIIYAAGMHTDITKEKECEDILEKTISSKYIGVIFFRDKIFFANDYVVNLTGLSKDALYQKRVEDFILNDKEREYIMSQKQKRLSGENIIFHKENAEILTKKRSFANIMSYTVLYDGKYTGFALITDVTEINKKNMFMKCMKKINDNIYDIKTKQAFFKILRHKIKKCLGYDMYLKYTDTEIGEKLIEYKNNIHIYHNINEKYKSALSIPFDDGGIIILYSEYENEFTKNLLIEYEELGKIIYLAIENINNMSLLRLLGEVVENSFQWIIITDENGKIIYANSSAEDISGYDSSELIGETPKKYKSDIHSEKFYINLWESLEKYGEFEDVFINKNKKGRLFYLKQRIKKIDFDDKIYYIAFGIDVTEEMNLKRERLTDEITSLLNRRGFIIQAQDKIKEDDLALIIFDIRNFKILNQVKGKVFCDYLLQKFAELLKNFFYDEDLIARIGHDEFAVLLRIKDSGQLKNIMNRFFNKLSNLNVDNISVNAGIVFCGNKENELEYLIEEASYALEFAKRQGDNVYIIYNDNIKNEANKYLDTKSLILDAIQNDKFDFYFQPYVDIQNMNITGAECLIRIIEEDKVIMPDRFIDFAEESGYIKQIEKMMIKKAVNYYSKLKIPLSFNVSSVSLKDKKHIRETFGNIQNIPLTIELTERNIADDIETAKEMFDFFKEKSFKIAIDDFGTGYSSFAYIKDLNFDILKIDIKFIQKITESQRDCSLVKGIIDLAKNMELTTIAEGVETKEQLLKLRKLGCGYAQGFYIAKPMPVGKFEEFLLEYKLK